MGILDRIRKKKAASEFPVPEVQARHRILNINDADVNDHWTIKHFLGQGSFSTVKLGVSKDDQKQRVAIKIIDKKSIDIKVQSIQTEVKILMAVRHENIISLMDVFEDNDKVYLVMELMTGGELFDQLCSKCPNGYSEKRSSIMLKSCIEAVQYLHSIGIIHRDLKPANLLFSSDEDDAVLKLADFGLAKIWSGDILVKTACGSPNYVAPEVLLNDMLGYDYACDMWSLGVILYVLLCGFLPFFDECTPALFAAITSGTYAFPEPYWCSISEEAKDLVSNLLVVDSKKRFTAEQALAHPWFASNKTPDTIIPDITSNMKKFETARASASFQ